MKRLIIFLILFLTTSLLNAFKVGNLENIFKPICMAIYENNLYVSDQGSVSIFNLKDLKFKKKFVKKGQGPLEFQNTPILNISQGKLLLHFYPKIARFAPGGKLIFEKKVPFFFFDIGAVKDNYVVLRINMYSSKRGNSISSIGLYDKNFKKIKTLASVERIIKKRGNKIVISPIFPRFKFHTYRNKIYTVAEEIDFRIQVFNQKGERDKEIKLAYENISVTDEDKKKYITDHKNFLASRKKLHYLKMTEFSFPDYFPAIKDFLVADGKIFVKTFLEKKGKEECWILTLSGKLIKKIFLPKVGQRFYTFSGGRFYYLIENDEEEEWELHYENI